MLSPLIPRLLFGNGLTQKGQVNQAANRKKKEQSGKGLLRSVLSAVTHRLGSFDQG
jgi:hypothetical protein